MHFAIAMRSWCALHWKIEVTIGSLVADDRDDRENSTGKLRTLWKFPGCVQQTGLQPPLRCGCFGPFSIPFTVSNQNSN